MMYCSINLDFQLMVWSFGKFSTVLTIWLYMMASSTVFMYPTFQVWAHNRTPGNTCTYVRSFCTNIISALFSCKTVECLAVNLVTFVPSMSCIKGASRLDAFPCGLHISFRSFFSQFMYISCHGSVQNIQFNCCGFS